MQFKFTEIPSLPRLAWCAKLNTGNDLIKVLHGPGVDIQEDWFFEGAWDGPFAEAGFPESSDCTGTGARIRDEKVVFVTPTHPYRALVTFKTRNGYIISNSLPFLLNRIGDKPDINYHDYYTDLFYLFNRGCIRNPRSLRMQNGSKIKLQFCCNLEFYQGSIKKLRKSQTIPPESFNDFKNRMLEMLIRTRENANDPARKTFYQPLITLSRGYDSVASAALGSSAGWKHAITLAPSDPHEEGNEDDGTPVAESLGLSIEKYDLDAWRKRTDIPETEFTALAWGGVMVRFAGIEDRLKNTLLILGTGGDRMWEPKSTGVKQNWGRPRPNNIISMGGESFWEFQLRVGIITVYPATFLALHWNELHHMMTDEEQKVWTIGKNYDRPFPRRIAEELGVPRELFGQKKMGLSHEYPAITPSDSGREDYLQFLRDCGLGEEFYKQQRLVPHHFHWGIERCMRHYDLPDNKQSNRNRKAKNNQR